ncbi:MAG: bifunctional [glutamine synthetase] adenylyltransferase/[glutamine synthetase]-adenylyl-L-tyrosine phosphorylase, partial [Propionibacteriaceae bacterium]|nr:bifunctional [glutamine synthetase] adenylyltransferase/[glutamine synthetase]-adenylyl-L-tyrosine phosphorylase [Propionibacteriaceae bacterium]
MTMPSQADWVRWGFLDPERAGLAATALESVRPGLAQMVGELLSSSADPDQGLVAFADLAAAGDVSGFDANQAGWQQLALLLGGSIGLGRWSRQRPIDLVAVTQGPSSLTKVPDILAHVLASDPATQIDELRWAYRRALAGIAAADLSDPDPLASLELTCEALTDIQDAVVEAAIIIARGLVPEAEKIRFGVVALGKVGAREANYLSDVDVLYVVEPAVVEGESACSAAEAVRIGTALAAKVMNICSAYTTAGTIWEIDATLRPEGAAGPLVRTLAGMRTYYESWAKNWEFQAMLKARAMAGDRSLAQGFVDMIAPLVWTAAERPGFVADAQAMRSRVVSLIPSVEANRDIKLGAGGLRDTEFSVQILQLVHGRLDERLRLPATLAGLNALIAYGYVGREDGAELAQAYRFQRLLEHRLQLYHLKRTHLMPTDEAGLRRLARSVGMKEADQVLAAWRTSAAKVLRLHQRIYYSPLLAAVARIPTSEIRLTQEAATIRLRALGYGDPSAALRHIEALTDGVSRRAEIMRQLLPALLGWIAAGPNPDAGLLAFRQVAEALGSTPFFLRALRDEGRLAQDLARVLSTSRYAASLMQRAPISVEVLLGGEQGNLSQELADVVNRYGADPRSAEIIRATRRRELLRIAAADILGTIDVCAVAQQLSELTDATLEAALTLARRSVEGAPPMAVIALGRWGGQEMAYASDADLMVVLEDSDDPEAIRKGAKVL